MFWDKEKSIDIFSPLTQEMIDYVEQQLQVTLPAHYIELLQQQNGGAIYHKAFPTNKKIAGQRIMFILTKFLVLKKIRGY